MARCGDGSSARSSLVLEGTTLDHGSELVALDRPSTALYKPVRKPPYQYSAMSCCERIWFLVVDGCSLPKGCVNYSTQLLRELSYLWEFSLDLDPPRMAGLFHCPGTWGFHAGYCDRGALRHRWRLCNGWRNHFI
jgi:hypothetical protein